jgi:prepilin-type N-terminal cleavage/methylation domain-containing protein
MKVVHSGFTLIEVALALMVASIGLMGILALFPAGLSLQKSAHDDTRTALFAEEVFNGIRAQATVIPWNNINRAVSIPPQAPHIWARPDDMVIRPSDTDGFTPILYRTRGAAQGGVEYLDFAMRYNLQIVDTANNRRKAVYLKIKPGEFGEGVTNRYYMELYNHGQQ